MRFFAVRHVCKILRQQKHFYPFSPPFLHLLFHFMRLGSWGLGTLTNRRSRRNASAPINKFAWRLQVLASFGYWMTCFLGRAHRLINLLPSFPSNGIRIYKSRPSSNSVANLQYQYIYQENDNIRDQRYNAGYLIIPIASFICRVRVPTEIELQLCHIFVNCLPLRAYNCKYTNLRSEIGETP
ncbi:hypothetical protein BDQ12DRAFT_392019 [Crucibulum laeve]|uniref:Uncharacterized protein n=1 Tax=Crucibulum laeve TaxID=68775 RepID=A0A5C3MB16_9AGAR|nr:hypothetical protein BDQ12DRAFT_392019 [Crucibulum laeve]